MPENAERKFHLHQHLIRSTRPCIKRDGLDQGDRARSGWRCCTRCSRITTRVDGEGMAWCGGELPAGDSELSTETGPVGHGAGSLPLRSDPASRRDTYYLVGEPRV